MKLVKNFLCAMVLVSAIAVNISAGEQHVPGIAQPQPTPTPAATSICNDNYPSITDCAEPVGDDTAETSDYLFFEALAALLSIY